MRIRRHRPPTCPTTDNGTRTVGGKIRDKDGGTNTYTATVTVNNVAPAATFNAPASVNEGSAISLSLTGASDPSSADTTAGFTYAFDCGSGFGAYSSTSTASCPTTDNGTRTVGASIRDKDGGTNTYNAPVTINNVAPDRNVQRPRFGQRGQRDLALADRRVRSVERRHHCWVHVRVRLRRPASAPTRRPPPRAARRPTTAPAP